MTRTQDDYKALDAELRAERAQAAELRASMQAELARVRGRREELERQLERLRARAKKKSDGNKPRDTEALWRLFCLLLIFTCGLGQSTLFRHVIAPLRCGGACSTGGSEFVGLFRRGGGGESSNIVAGCVCSSTSQPAWLSTSDDSVIFTEWFGVARLLGSFALPILILIGVILGYKMRRKRARAS